MKSGFTCFATPGAGRNPKHRAFEARIVSCAMQDNNDNWGHFSAVNKMGKKIGGITQLPSQYKPFQFKRWAGSGPHKSIF